MAAQKQQPQELVINLRAEVQKLKEMREAIELLKQEGKLSNVNENTYKSLFTQIDQAVKRLNESIRDGAIGVTGLNNIKKGFEHIKTTIGKMVAQEKSTGMGLEEYNKKLETATKNVEDQIAAIEKLKKQKKELLVTEKGNAKQGREVDVMNSARQQSRGNRKGADTKAEALLKGGDLKAIKQGAAAGDPAATKALQLYNQELARQAEEFKNIQDQIVAAREELTKYKAELNQIKSTSAFDEGAVKDLENMGDSAEKSGQQMGTAAKKLEEIGKTSAKVGKDVNASSMSFGQMLKKAAGSGAWLKMLVTAGKAAIKTIKELDEAITDMAIATGTSRDQLYAQVGAFNKLARETGATTTEVAKLTAEYMKQGRTMQDSMVIAEQTAKAAKIAGISTADSIEYMTSAINGFNLAASDAEHVSDVFAKLAAVSATDYEELAIALSKVSAQANTAGMSMEFTTTLLAKGLEVTQEAPESIGTALKTVIARFRELSDYGATLEDGASVNKMESALAVVGISLRDANGQFRNLEDIMNELGPKWDDLSTMQQQAIAQAAAGTRQQSRFLAIMQDWDRTVELGNAALEAEGATLYQHNQYADGLEHSINRIETAWQGVVSQLTDAEVIKGTFSFIATVVETIVDGIDLLNENTGGVLGTVVTILGLGGAAAFIVKKIHDTVKGIKDWFAEIKNSLTGQKDTENEIVISGDEQVKNQKEINQEKSETLNLAKEQLEVEKEILDAKKQQGDAESENNDQKKKDEKKDKKEDKKEGKQEKKEEQRADKAEAKKEKKKDKAQKREEKKLEKARKKQEKADAKAEKKKEKAADKKNKRQEKEKEKQHQADIKREEKLGETQLTAEQQTSDAVGDTVVAREEGLDVSNDTADATQQVTQAQTESTTVQTVNTGLSEVEEQNKEEQLDAEEEISEEEGKQLATNTGDLAVENAELATKKQSTKETKKETAEETKGLFVKLGSAVAKAFSSLGPIGGAVAAVAITAIVAGLVGMAISGGGGGTAAKEDVSEAQNSIYEDRQKKSSIDSALDEYKELQNKQHKTQEDYDRMAAIEGEMGELDGSLKGLSGAGLVQAMETMSEDLDKSIDKNIEKAWDATKRGANTLDFWGQSRAEEFLTSDEGRLARKEMADLETRRMLKAEGIDEKYQQEIVNSASSMFSTLTDQEIQAMLDSGMSADEVSKYIENFAQRTGDAAKDMAMVSADTRKAAENAAANGDLETARKLENEALIQDLQEYNKQMAEAADDPELQKAIEAQYHSYALLSNNITDVAEALDSGIMSSSILNLANKFEELGYKSELLGVVLDNLVSKGDGTYSISDIANWDDSQWQQAATAAGLDWSTMDETARKKFQAQVLDAAVDQSAGGITKANIGEYRTNISGNIDTVMGIKDTIMSGDELSQEDQEYLRDNYASLYSNAEFQEALKSGNSAKAAKMLEDEEAKIREDKINNTQTAIDNSADAFEAKYGVSYEDFVAGERGNMSTTDIAAATQEAADIQYLKDSKAALEEYKYEYEGLTGDVQKLEEATARYDEIQEKIDKRDGMGTKEDYAEMRKVIGEAQAIAQKQLDETKAKFTKMFGDNALGSLEDSLMSIDEETGEITVNMDNYAKLSAHEKQLFDEQLEILREQNDELVAQKDTIDEINEMERDAQVEIQEQALAAMQARLDAEYEATKESLDKRRELYSKYFDALDEESEEEDYENDRQKLLNKIAALSTATDGESLAKLKEAQEELNSLDDEHAQSERDARREAVEASFDSQEEGLDAAYDEAMSNVQGMWEEFCAMAGEDQLALFQQYGEGFQDVTDLQKTMAMETLDALMNQINSYGFNTGSATVDVTPTVSGDAPANAEGGLVDYTGLAWVDGSKTKPEAFLDAEDTANISMLAQGLRAMVAGSMGMEGSGLASGITINELNINVNGGPDGQTTGSNVADGFMKAIRELGININKQG
jgi:TP901 family phage tail tape measure protein